MASDTKNIDDKLDNTVDEKTKIRRVAELHVGIGAIQIDTMCFDRVVSMELNEDDVFIIEAQKYKKPLRLQNYRDPTILEDWEHTFASINMCQHVIARNLEWITWLTESEYHESLTRFVLNINEGQGFQIREISFSDPNPRHRFECHYIDSGHRTHSEACNHTVLTFGFADRSEQVVSDPSHAQYSFEKGIEDLSEYKKTKLHADSLTRDDGLGMSVELMRKAKMSLRQRAREIIIKRTVNNIVFEEVKQLGGAKKFLNLKTQEFEKARDSIFARARSELEFFRRELDRVAYRLVRNKAALQTLVRECCGHGNRSCLASYKRKVKTTP